MDEDKINFLKGQLNDLLNSEFREFGNLQDLDGKIGVYSIWRGNDVIYVGKTIDQTLKKRVSSIMADFRTHTLNKKLFIEIIGEKYKDKIEERKLVLKKTFGTKKMIEFIDKGIFTEEEFSKLKEQLRNEIRTNLKIKCLVIDNKEDVTSFEHFAIAIKSPKYND